MDVRRARSERNMLPLVGPSFFRDGEAVLFQFVIDPGNVIGPRPATDADKIKHAAAWAVFGESDSGAAMGDGSAEEPVPVVQEAPRRRGRPPKAAT
jgi:hypothetical protein